MRALICAFALTIYAISFNTYIFLFGAYPSRYMKLWYNYTTLFLILFIFIDLKIGIVSGLHKQFNDICQFTIMFNFILIILYHHSYGDSGISKLIAFNGSIFVVTVMVLFSGLRHGYFKNKHEND